MANQFDELSVTKSLKVGRMVVTPPMVPFWAGVRINEDGITLRNNHGHDTIKIDREATKLDLGKISMSGDQPSLWVGSIGIEPRTPTSLPNLLGICERTKIYSFEVDPNSCKLWMRRSNGTNAVTIDGEAGDVILENADCAEDFEITEAEQIEAGSVVALNNAGQLEKSWLPYDKRVAGVVSGAGDLKPGLVLGRRQGQKDRLPIALMGRVNCRVDADYGSVEVGDLLTTSSTPGYAMKASDPTRSFGAVIGKAMHPLKDGRSLIPILVALQ